MCGITGFVSSKLVKNEKEIIIKKMTDRIIHRGPDGEGFYVDDLVALGHRRLAIIDIESGVQPMFNEDDSLVVVFNGEIYNYQEIKEDLISQGHTFKTNSDTEVLLHGYETWGIGLPMKLRGMFAFVIWDEQQNILFGARDHFGIKPFYYANMNNTFMFASEIKAMLDHPDFLCELNKDLIAPYLSFNFTPGENTLFKGVKKLLPGHYFLYKDNNLLITKYFEVTFNEENKEYSKIIDDISEAMKSSVEHHQISDVEVGAFLSSGIDSSYIVSLAKPNKTYTVGYENPKYNEINYAKELADKLGIQNNSKIISKEEYFDVIPKLMYHLDEPLADPAAVALYFVSDLASKSVKVVLSGEGADEFFAGYNYYNTVVKYQNYNKLPLFLRKTFAGIANIFPYFRGRDFFIRNSKNIEDYYIGVNYIFNEIETKKILKDKNVIQNNTFTKPYLEKLKNKDEIVKMQTIDINFSLAQDILQKADKITMAASIEGRVPFCDIKVFDIASSMPKSAKVTKDATKVALRKAAKRDIPNESYKKKKLGFPVPLREWLKDDDIYEVIKRSFNKTIAKEIFETEEIMKLLDEHKESKKDNYKKIWSIYCFITWYEQFFTN